jgi:hypothetical protein
VIGNKQSEVMGYDLRYDALSRSVLWQQLDLRGWLDGYGTADHHTAKKQAEFLKSFCRRTADLPEKSGILLRIHAFVGR